MFAKNDVYCNIILGGFDSAELVLLLDFIFAELVTGGRGVDEGGDQIRSRR